MIDFWRVGIDPDHLTQKVLIERDTLIDDARDNRPVKIKVYYPDDGYDGQELPVILWSHGLGGSADGAAFLSRYMAAQGYIMVHVQHHGTDTSIWEGKEGHPWDVIRKTPITRFMTLNRFNDIPYVLKVLPEWFGDNNAIKCRPNFNAMGMSGHSFGALTTQVMAGMLFPNKHQKLVSFKQNIFKAAIAYSPGDISHLGDFDEEESYGAITTPLFHVTGTEDKSPLTGEGYEIRTRSFQKSAEGVTKHLLVLQDADHMVFAGSRGKLGANKNREKHERILKIASVAWWDSLLKNNQDAQKWLSEGKFIQWLGDEGNFQ